LVKFARLMLAAIWSAADAMFYSTSERMRRRKKAVPRRLI
jgi:hypothetical protein